MSFVFCLVFSPEIADPRGPRSPFYRAVRPGDCNFAFIVLSPNRLHPDVSPPPLLAPEPAPSRCPPASPNWLYPDAPFGPRTGSIQMSP